MTERIGDVNDSVTAWLDETKECRHPEHNPPGMMVYTPGRYKHTCPRCGKVQFFTIHKEF